MTEHYIVTQDGVYQAHSIYGPFTDLEAACEKARDLAKTDRDNYHEYVVGTITPEQGQGPALYAVKRKKRGEHVEVQLPYLWGND